MAIDDPGICRFVSHADRGPIAVWGPKERKSGSRFYSRIRCGLRRMTLATRYASWLPARSGVAMGLAGWAKSRGAPSEGAPEFQFQGQSYKEEER